LSPHSWLFQHRAKRRREEVSTAAWVDLDQISSVKEVDCFLHILKRPNMVMVLKSNVTNDVTDDLPLCSAGSDKEAILDLVTGRSNAQRQEIVQAYKSSYGKDLIDDLKYELTGHFERLIVSLMRPQAYHDAKEIHDAIKGAGTDEKCLIEVLASRNNQQIHELVEAYKDAYGSDIEEDVTGETSGHFKKMLVVLLQVSCFIRSQPWKQEM
ncbi:unnamed protein product, partial [Oncorhynchus mykiss]